MKDKLAEEILDNLELDGDWQAGDIYYKHEVIRAMQAYHEAKMKEVTDADIVKWANSKEKIIDEMPETLKLRITKKIECRIEGARWAIKEIIKRNQK